MTTSNADTRLILEGSLDVSVAAELHERLLACLRGGGPIVVDAVDVDHADTSILQLLVALWRAASESGVEICWENVSPGMSAAARLIGLCADLSLPETSPNPTL